MLRGSYIHGGYMNFTTAINELCNNNADVKELARKHRLNKDQVSALCAMSQKLASSNGLTSSALAGMMIM